MRRTSLNHQQARLLANLLKRRREELGLSQRAVIKLSGVASGTLVQLERGEILAPQPDTLRSLGRVLGIGPYEIFSTIDWLTPDELPAIGTYLRAKYRDLSDDAIRELQAHLHDVSDQIKPSGPVDGEDES